MAKPHKRSSAGLNATTTLDRVDIAQLAQDVAGQARGNAWKGSGTVRLEAAGPDQLDFSICERGMFKRELMTFALTTNEDHAGRREVRINISDYKTSQQAVGGIIPVAPKQLLGFNVYREFLELFAAALKRQDASANAALAGMDG